MKFLEGRVTEAFEGTPRHETVLLYSGAVAERVREDISGSQVFGKTQAERAATQPAGLFEVQAASAGVRRLGLLLAIIGLVGVVTFFTGIPGVVGMSLLTKASIGLVSVVVFAVGCLLTN